MTVIFLHKSVHHLSLDNSITFFCAQIYIGLVKLDVIVIIIISSSSSGGGGGGGGGDSVAYHSFFQFPTHHFYMQYAQSSLQLPIRNCACKVHQVTQKIVIYSGGIIRHCHNLHTYVLMAVDCTTLA
jgi:hypothetical protein